MQTVEFDVVFTFITLENRAAGIDKTTASTQMKQDISIANETAFIPATWRRMGFATAQYLRLRFYFDY